MKNGSLRFLEQLGITIYHRSEPFKNNTTDCVHALEIFS